MILDIKRTVLAAAVGGAMTLAPAPSKAFTLPKAPSTATAPDDVAELKQKLDATKVQLDATKAELAATKKTLDRLSGLIDGKLDEKGFPLPLDPGVVADLKEMKNKMAEVNDLRKKVDDLQKQLGELKTTTSLRPNMPLAPNLDPLAGKGIVRVVNQYPVEISMVVNNTAYKIAPSKSIDVQVPMGKFSYQLLESASGATPTESAVREKETVTLRIK